jgi:hypothetical protein
VAQPSLAIRFAESPEQRIPLTPEQFKAFQVLWDQAPVGESEEPNPAIASALNELKPALGDEFLAANSGKITMRSGRLFDAQGFTWQR